jgi:tetratricopeptide (TPR) repeat protein
MERAHGKAHGLVLCLTLALATFLTFEQVRLNDFVTFDDNHYVTENPNVKAGITPESLTWALTATYYSNWHPITWVSHMLDIDLYGLTPAGHHLSNVLFHILNAVLLFGLLQRMTGRLWPSAFVAALFALHPLHVEPVAWVSERKEILSTFLGLLSVWAYVGYAQRGNIARYLLTFFFLALGLMAKPMLVTLPMLLLLLDYWPLDRIRLGRSESRNHLDAQAGLRSETLVCPRQSIARVVAEKIPLFALSVASSVITFHVQRGSMEPGDAVAFKLRAANALMSYVRYMGKMFWPSDLSVLYTHPNLPGGTPWAEWQVAGAGVLLLGISLLLVVRATRERYGIVGWLWYLGTLVPVIGLVQVGGQAMADRYTYTPLIGLFIIIAWCGADAMSRWRSRNVLMRPTFALLTVSALVACTTCSRSQVRIWHDSVALYTHALEVDPGNPTMHSNLGNRLRSQGEFDRAIHHYQEAVRAKPDYAKAHYGLAAALDAQGKSDEAIRHYRQALHVEPDYAAAHNDLGAVLASQGRLDVAISHYRQALRVRPDYAAAHYNLARVVGSQGRLDEAISHYRQVVQVQPDFAEAHYNLGVVLGSQGKLDEAIGHYRQAVQIKPDYANAHNNLGVLLAAQGKLDPAVAHYREALRATPGYAEAHYNLGVVLAAGGELEAAINHYRQALHIKPGYADAHNNLGVLLATQGKHDEAIDHYREALRAKPNDANARRNLEAALRERAP